MTRGFFEIGVVKMRRNLYRRAKREETAKADRKLLEIAVDMRRWTSRGLDVECDGGKLT